MSKSNKMENLLGLLRISVIKGMNLAIRDVVTSDPYVVIRMGRQKLKTRVINKSVNPEWNEELTLSIFDPTLPLRLEVYDKDTFSQDDKMGDANIDIEPFLEAAKLDFSAVPNGTTIRILTPNRNNCLAELSHIIAIDGKIYQDMCLRLKNVECGEVKIRLHWIDVPGSKGIKL